MFATRRRETVGEACRRLARGMASSVQARWRAILVSGVAAALAASGAFVLLRPLVEARVRARVERAASRLGFTSRLGDVHLTPWMSFELRDLVLEAPGRARVTADKIVLRPRLSPRGLIGRAVRVAVSQVSADLPAGLGLELQPSAWVVESRPPELRVWRLRSGEQLELATSDQPRGRTLRAHASAANLSQLVRVLVRGCPLVDLGTIDGDVRLDRDATGVATLSLRGQTRGFALASLAAAAGPPCENAALGAPTDVEAEVEAKMGPEPGRLRADRFRLAANGALATGQLAIDGGPAAPRIDFQFAVARLDFARMLASAGVGLPADDLGSAGFAAHVTGPLREPAALTVTQRVDFTAPARPLPALTRLKGPFLHRIETPGRPAIQILVSPESPDFVPLEDVPPLFVRTLLIGEDANFFGHRGIDLSELPVALATNLARGTFVRGASTISQQLAKNLFLSRKKTLSRKLEEASLALLLDATLGKQRVLEIYLNVIEWGPGLYGLRPAARYYFGKEPAALTPRQMAFLVSLIPGPVLYQRSFATGTPTPFFDGLMNALLTKLRSVDALSEDEYQAALAEPLGLQIPSAQPEPVAPPEPAPVASPDPPEFPGTSAMEQNGAWP